MTRNECIRALLNEYAAQRTENEKALEARCAEAEARDPQIAVLRAENINLAMDTLKRIATLTEEAARRDAAIAMRERGLHNNAEIRTRLKLLGLPEDYLTIRPRCPICRDTGYVGQAPSRFCECFETRLHAMQYRDGGFSAEETQSFETFSLDIFPEADEQRARMAGARRFCEDYANALPQPARRNLLLMGTGGLGKTFLLNCIYVRAVDRNVSAIRLSAFRMFEIMRAQHQNAENTERSFRDLIDVPLLCIDDLGSEPMMRNITVEYLFLLLNERMAAGRCTVVTTNHTAMQLQQRYGERVLSRMLDKMRWSVLTFRGKDVRTL